jgi:serine/threonine-protein kinase
MTKSSATLAAGTVLNDRYKIISELGRGGFGRTYLAEDVYRYHEKCVLKEFAPEVGDDQQLHKATELFNREAGILYKLNHDRIPTFQALIRSLIEGKECLFLAQQYIEGETYLKLLNQGKKFTEEEATRLLFDVLDILEYIHSLNLIHRDISPDNLIRRKSDGKPILIDFGCVKEAANVAVRNQHNSMATAIGKKGYAPDEQLRLGQVFHNSDLYSLAVTILVLLTGKEPEDLYNSYNAAWYWKHEVRVSENLERVLDKMLAHLPNDRFFSAKDVRMALERKQQTGSVVNTMLSRIRTMVVTPKANSQPDPTYNYPQQQPNSNANQTNNNFLAAINNAITRVGALAAASPLGNLRRNQVQNNPTPNNINGTNNRSPQQNTFVRNWKKLAILGTGALVIPALGTYIFIRNSFLPEKNTDKERVSNVNNTEIDRRNKILGRVDKLKLDRGSFFQEVNESFWKKYPNLKGIKLSPDSKEHKKYRYQWYQIAEDLLNKKEGK